jgi:hypothetical protein
MDITQPYDYKSAIEATENLTVTLFFRSVFAYSPRKSRFYILENDQIYN